ncbi:MAG: caspase family protein [Deltaproteobacteria bacterium]|nr:caspase family protein [Deltaproteobacteria bacterium]
MLAALATLIGLTTAALPPPGETRYALIVGAHEGASGEVTLAFAGRDAKRVGDALVQLGGFLPDNVVTLIDPDSGRMRDALARLNARLRAERGPNKTSVLFVYYSGHADERALHLGDTAVPWDELVNNVQGSAAELRVLVVDACRSGFATRVKGLRPDVPFALPVAVEPAAEGMAILASATQGEDAQESEALGASFFTHHLLAGLRGAADANDDSLVTLEEVYRYARDQTVASTATTATGVQHPTYRWDFKGRANVVLATLAATRSQGVVVLPGEGRFLFHEGRVDGPLASEVVSRGVGTRVLLPAGRYGVRWRRPARYHEGVINVVAQKETAIDASSLQVFEYARLVRKGGAADDAWELMALGQVASPPLAAYDATPGIALGASLDLSALGLDALLWYGASASAGDGLAATAHELGLVVGVRKSFDVGPVALGLGVRGGLVALAQSFEAPDEATRRRLAPLLEVPLRAAIVLDGPLSLVLEGGLRVSPREVLRDDESAEATWLGAWGRLGLAWAMP